eukprot:5375910-Karenia_brevis.AAC.1
MRDGVLIIGERWAAPVAPVRSAAAGPVFAGARRGALPASGAAGQVKLFWFAMEDLGFRRRKDIIDRVYEHGVLSRVLGNMVQVEQSNTPSLQSADLLSRRMQ